MKSKINVIYALLIMTVFINIWFPKAGIKVAGIPITVGTIAFGLLIIAWLISNKKMQVSKIHLYILISELYFLLRIIIAYCTGVSISDLVGYALPLIIYPFIFIIITNYVNEEEKYDKIMKIIVCGFFFLCAYSLLQYVFGISNVAIPGITVNYSDYAEYGANWYFAKNNGTAGNNSKIIATYQNGNLLGVSLIIIFPIVYEYLLSRKKEKLSLLSLALFVLIVFLTLARSCWLGIILFLLLRIALHEWTNKREVIKKIGIMICGIIGIVFIFIKFPSVSARVMNMNFEKLISATGRTEGAIEILKDMLNSGNLLVNYLIGGYGFIETDGFAYEVTPMAFLYVTGIIGLTLWLTIIIKFIKNMNKKDNIENSFRLAVIIYFWVACVEGAYWLVPTALNLFTVMGLGYSYKKIYNKTEELKK